MVEIMPLLFGKLLRVLVKDLQKEDGRRIIRLFGFSFMCNFLLVALGGIFDFPVTIWAILLFVSVMLFAKVVEKPTQHKNRNPQ